MTTAENRTRLGRDLEEAFTEMAAYLRGEVEAESYEAANGVAHRLADAVKASLAL